MPRQVRKKSENPQKSWKELVDEAVRSLPREFSLDQALKFEPQFVKSYPANKNIDAKIRQTLQILRDQGVLEFLGGGKYRRLNVAPSFSLQVEPGSSPRKSRSQISGSTVETWVESNLYCVACGSDLRRLPVNFKVSDFDCLRCGELYQVKASLKPLTSKVLGAAYAPLLEAASTGKAPNYILVHVDETSALIRNVRVFKGSEISGDRIIPRKRLSETARRAGWQGCVIDVSGLSYIEPVSCPDKNTILFNWKKLT